MDVICSWNDPAVSARRNLSRLHRFRYGAQVTIFSTSLS